MEELVKEPEEELVDLESNTSIKLLALGDSYTIGESVCKTCRFPEQLKTGLLNQADTLDIDLEVIAQTGWTTSNLKQAIANTNVNANKDLVTLLIGVNNQFQGLSFSTFETEFKMLLNTAISLTKGKKDRVIVISIPDYAYTSFGNGNTSISNDIDKYNNFISNYCETSNVTYIYITDITRNGIENTALVASDGLHPSELAYSKFVDRILPIAISKLNL